MASPRRFVALNAQARSWRMPPGLSYRKFQRNFQNGTESAPLINLREIADEIGVGTVWAKILTNCFTELGANASPIDVNEDSINGSHGLPDGQTRPQDFYDYSVLMQETDEQLGSYRPDLIIAPVDIARGAISHFKSESSAYSTAVSAVEPDTAACLFKSLEIGESTTITTTHTIMTELRKRYLPTGSWDILKQGIDASLTVSDFEAHQAVLYLQSHGIQAGPAGAASLAALKRLTISDRKSLRLTRNSTVVIFCPMTSDATYDTPHDVSADDPILITQTLVRINSASPTLGSVAGPGETVVAQYIASWLEHRDITTHWIESAKGRPSVVGVIRGSGRDGAKSLMLNGHIDTVTLMGYENDPLSGKIINGKLHGRGSADMKSGVAAAMVALANVKRLELNGVKLGGDVIFTAVADEESGSIGTESILRAGWRADAAIVSEPTGLQIFHAHKGFCDIEVVVHGVAAHGSRPDLGVDAIINAGYFLSELGNLVKQIHQGIAGAGRDMTLGTANVHASTISGGEEISSYPAQCKVLMEWRTIPGETKDFVESKMRQLIADVAKVVPGFKADFRIIMSRPPMATASNHPFVELVTDVVGDVLGSKATLAGAPYWTDCALLAEAGIVPLVWGPKGEGLHSKEEWVDIDSIVKVAEGLTNVINRFCR
ncbi:hypothetical protein FOVG_16608 [Fusarium oxysporum f. sp. pisi HDV247]|uniref:Probable succinyl-diaminopimelate desuccinylase n=1 Tax=Fusarium oxysporum f. sp. pisi HDV247 TaxID=1080344 RepID=W9NN07_FUSOX|nr:hypothetical protein FOVG_16608 [Fusarium oxysporum f. sp. pisi HDV247]